MNLSEMILKSNFMMKIFHQQKEHITKELEISRLYILYSINLACTRGLVPCIGFI